MSLRVGLLCHHGVGGSARVAVELGRALATRGHQVHFFARETPPGLPGREPGVTVHTTRRATAGALTAKLDADWSSRDLDAFAAQIAAVTREADLDVLHFHYAVPFAAVLHRVAWRLGRQRPALIGTLHGTDVSVLGARGTLSRELASLLPRFDALTTVSRSYAELATRTFRLPTPPTVIPNFVSLMRFRPRTDDGTRRPAPRIVHVSNFRAVKQPVSVARIYATVRARSDARLWLVGDGEGMPAVRAALASDGLLGVTRFFGLRLDLERILPGADLMLITSRDESFCLAALEAAACGVPAVAPRVGGLPETVWDGQTGHIYEAGDEAGAAGAVVALLGDSARRAALADAAVRRARLLSTDAIVPAYTRVYELVLASRQESVRTRAMVQ